MFEVKDDEERTLRWMWMLSALMLCGVWSKVIQVAAVL
jgi:hypothetical protein